MMDQHFFIRLAADNLKKNRKSYFPYILICIFTAAMFYIVKSLSLNPGLERMVGADTLCYIMHLGSIATALFALVFLFYAYSFVIKRRKKEFGIFNILGMEKRHLAKVLAWEMLSVSSVSISGGILSGMALDKIMFLLITKIIGSKVTLGFFLSAEAILTTLILFAIIFLIIYLYSVCQIHLVSPAGLLYGSSAGEKSPEANWLIGILGILCIGTGYGISLTTDKPLSKAAPYFFGAVILVIIGTYLFFTASSIILLKLLQKQKGYYYQTKHFIRISNMLYRMKQNAAGLANICILSTMVLVMVSSTSCLVLGMDDIIRTQYPNEFDIYITEENPKRQKAAHALIRQLQQEQNLDITAETQYRYLIVSATEGENGFLPVPADSVTGESNEANFIFIPLDDYNQSIHTDKTLGTGEILVYSSRKRFGSKTLHILGKSYMVKEALDAAAGNGILAASETSSYFIVVPSMEEIQSLCHQQRKELGNMASGICSFYGFDTSQSEKEQEDFYSLLMDSFAMQEYQGTVESRADAKANQTGAYGGFFFIGTFLGVLFTVAMVLIIYYKQIAEGYDDRERFHILQQLGMSQKEIKAFVHSQVRTVFFLPALLAGIHTAAAFPMISKILLRLNLRNTALYAATALICYAVFLILYFAIYHITAKTYYHLIKKGGNKHV